MNTFTWSSLSFVCEIFQFLFQVSDDVCFDCSILNQITQKELIMSSRNRMAAQGVLNARASTLNNPSLGLMRQNPGLYGNQGRPQNMGPPPLMNGPPGVLLLEQKVNSQHTELQRLLTENQRLAATHVALRQELAAAQQEVQRMQSMVQGLQTDKEVQVR